MKGGEGERHNRRCPTEGGRGVGGGGERGRNRSRKAEGRGGEGVGRRRRRAFLPFCHSVPLLSPPPHLPHPKAPPLPAPLIQLLSRDKSPTSLLPIALSPSLLSPSPILHYYYYYTTKGRHSCGHAAKSGRSGKKRGEEGWVAEKRGASQLSFQPPPPFNPNTVPKG